MTPLNFLIATLATWQVVEIWRHSEICGGLRARVECCEGSSRRIIHYFGRLLACGYCLSVWVATGFGPLLQETQTTWPVWREFLIAVRWLAYGLAVSRCANLGNDLTYQWCRTVKHDKLLPDQNSKAYLETTHDGAGTDVSLASSESSDVRLESGGDGGAGYSPDLGDYPRDS